MDIKISLLPKQKLFVSSSKPNTLFLAGRGSGKSYAESILAATNVCKGNKVLVLAQNYRSLSLNLFQEIENRLKEWNVSYDYNHSNMTITVQNGSIYGFSYENIDSLRGLTNISVAILDEIALAPIPDILFAALYPCLRGENIIPKIYFATTPRAGSAWNTYFKNVQNREDYLIIRSTTYENTYLTEESLELMSSNLSNDMKKQEMLGELLDGAIENCIVNISDISTEKRYGNKKYSIGIDFARFGNDSTSIVLQDSLEIVDIRNLQKADTNEIVTNYLEITNIIGTVPTYLDGTGGYSSGFFDSLKCEYDLTELNFAGKPNNENYSNIRTEIYFELAEAIRHGFYIDSNKYSDILEALKATSYFINSVGKRALVPKENIKRIIGHSPDNLDALALSFYKKQVISQTNLNTRVPELMNFLFR